MINTLILPERQNWESLCARPLLKRKEIEKSVRAILDDVKANGDPAIERYSTLFDGVHNLSLAISAEEISDAVNEVPEELKKAIDLAKNNIELFHRAQIKEDEIVETTKGVLCWRKSIPIERAGLYIPGGNAPLFSTVLMLGIPAVIAGCDEIILCTPPGKEGNVNSATLYAASLLGINKIYRVGGAQAIAAMAYGTATIPKANKIFGPGNQYVTMAKEVVQSEGTAIDMPAGPSEVMVIADNSAYPEFIAADLLSQAEHGPDSQVMLLSDDIGIIRDVKQCLYQQLPDLPGKDIAIRSLNKSNLILLPDLDACVTFSNIYAPEHLIIATGNALKLSEKVKNAGSVFLGNYSCESAGDYASGTNHTLPTNGYAAGYSGLSVDSYLKKITFQMISEEGLNKIGPAIETMAEAETLYGHRNAVTIRLKKINHE